MPRVGWFEIFSLQIVGDFFLMLQSIQRHSPVCAAMDLTVLLVAVGCATVVCADEEAERA